MGLNKTMKVRGDVEDHLKDASTDRGGAGQGCVFQSSL